MSKRTTSHDDTFNATIFPHRREISQAIALLVPVREALKNGAAKRCGECGHFHFENGAQQITFSTLRRTIKQLDDLLIKGSIPYDPA